MNGVVWVGSEGVKGDEREGVTMGARKGARASVTRTGTY